MREIRSVAECPQVTAYICPLLRDTAVQRLCLVMSYPLYLLVMFTDRLQRSYVHDLDFMLFREQTVFPVMHDPPVSSCACWTSALISVGRLTLKRSSFSLKVKKI